MSLILMFLAWAHFLSDISVYGDPIFDVTAYGAKGDGMTDDTEALLKLFSMVCNGVETSPLILIPSERRFVVHPTDFEGPCKPEFMKLQIEGQLIPHGVAYGGGSRWVTFRRINNLQIWGTGGIEGNGPRVYTGSKHEEVDEREEFVLNKAHDEEIKNEDNIKKLGKIHKNKDKGDEKKAWPSIEPTSSLWEKATNVAFFGCNHLRIDGITSSYSERNHFSISSCEDVIISNIHIISPGTSKNTDGIDISHSTFVSVLDSHIETGDDCIAINEGCSHIIIERVHCGPGHGISIGSFKRRLANVESVEVRHCTISDATNGARIKTFDDGDGGFVRGVIFEDITLENVKHPIIIDQYYHEFGSNLLTNATDDQIKAAVEINDVTFRGFRGTCSDDIAITLNCRGGPGCNEVHLIDVNIIGSRGQPVRADCHNVHGTSELVSPIVECLNGASIDSITEEN